MKDFNNKISVILYGPPGSGKGTQARLLVDRFRLFNFDTGDFLRKLIYRPDLQKNKIIQREKRLNESGKLQTPSFVLKFVSQRVKELLDLRQSIVFSGSPRTFFEAFGSGRTEGLVKVLEKGYGKKNLFIFILDIPESESIKRNAKRLVCSVCKIPLLKSKLTACPFCGGKIMSRVDDNPKIVKTRLKEYGERTKPIFKELKKRKYYIRKIDGTPAPYKIHEKVVSYLTK